MHRLLWLLVSIVATGGAVAAGGALNVAPAHGSMIQHDADVAKEEPGTHKGGGQTIGYSFFAKAPGLPFVFRKRALHAGSGIGLHTQTEDEVYYVLSGKGEMTLDGERHDITPGTAILTRTGSSHSLKQIGAEDLVIIITYPQQP
jgi:mannose-6-phosphate isomerase-like protein (cupin superfamily)